MKPTSKIAKGKLLEDYVANCLVQSGLDPSAIRQKGSGSGLAKGDIHTQLKIHFEVKNTENFGGKAWFDQVKEENVSHYPYAICWKPPRMSLEETKVIIDLDYFIDLLLAQQGQKPITENPKLKYPLMQLKDLCRKILMQLGE